MNNISRRPTISPVVFNTPTSAQQCSVDNGSEDAYDDSVMCNDYSFVMWMHQHEAGGCMTFCRAVQSVRQLQSQQQGPTLSQPLTAACDAIKNTFIVNNTLTFLPSDVVNAILSYSGSSVSARMFDEAYECALVLMRRRRAEYLRDH